MGGESGKVYVRGVNMDPFFDPKTDYGLMVELGANGEKKWARGIVPHVQATTRWPLAEGFKI